MPHTATIRDRYHRRMRAVPTATVLASLLPPVLAQVAAPSRELAEAAAAYAAKVAASAIFVSGRTLESVLAEELAPTRPLEAMIRPLLRFEVDSERRRVTCRLGAASAAASATGNLGCTLERPGIDSTQLQQRASPGLAELQVDPRTQPWPLGDQLPKSPADDVDHRALAAVLDAAFAEPESGPKRHTRAVVIVHRGRLLAERYATGYGVDTPLPGWSMTKTLTHALLGVRIRQERLDPAAPLPVPEWPADDPRRSIRLGDLLAMRGGLQWNEDYDDAASTALRMLFGSSDHAAVYAECARAHAPGEQFVYASGATNLLCRVLRRTFTDDREYWAFPRQHLFAPLGMRTAVLETDPNGTFVGSSYGFASARDWARLGMLYAQDGMFAGQRILPAGWVAAAGRPHPRGDGNYGAHVWLNADPDQDGPRQRAFPELPADLLRMDGHEGQYCAVFPSEQLVVVRLGCTKNGGFDLRGLMRGALAAVAKPAPAVR